MFLRHRSAKSIKSRASEPSRSARLKGVKAVHWAVEQLECRRLLTTITGGDVLQFKNEDGNQETVAAFGSITAEVIGANVDGANNLVLENLPGILNGANINGGEAIPPGATLVGPLTITTPTMAPLVIPPTALAVDPVGATAGQMWAIAIQTTPAMGTNPATNAVYLVQIDDATGMGMAIVDISQEVLSAAGIPPGTPNAEVTAVPAAAFNPTNGLLYFVAQTGSSTAGTTTAAGTETLMTVDVNNPSPQTTVSAIPGDVGGQIVKAFTFQNNQIVASAGTNIFTVNTLNSNLISAPATLTGINGMVSGLADDTQNNLIYAITSDGAMSEVYTVNTAGAALDFGPLPNGPLGQNPGGLTFDPTTDTLFSDDLQTKQLFTVSTVNRTRNLSVYQIYISQSDGGSIFEWSGNAPFGPGITGLNVINAQTGKLNLIMSPTNSGDALIGARTRVVVAGGTGAEYVPILSGMVPQTFGVAPYTVGQTITSGIVSAPGTTMGTIALSGTLLGGSVINAVPTPGVDIQGSIDTMYVGWLLTGDANGEPGLNIVSVPGNFTVLGDLQTLIVGASIGTDTDVALTKPTFLSGFDMVVGGVLGEIQTYDSLIGNINVQNTITAPDTLTTETELEDRDLIPGVTNPWASGILWGVGAVTSVSNSMFTNDTFATAQYLGALPVAAGDLPSQVVLDGTLQADTIEKDYVDYYGVALLAGQTITCQVVPTAPGPPIDLGVFDPDGALVASDYNQTDQGETENAFFRFTTTEAGVYRFAVANNTNTTFVDGGAPLNGDTPYQLTVQGTGNLAAGAIVAANNIFDNVDPTQPEASYGTGSGDLGALIAGGVVFSTNAGDTVNATDGNLRDITAYSIGLDMATTLTDDPEIQVNGDVGVIDATNMPPTTAPAGLTSILFFNDPDQSNPGVLPPPITGNYQLIESATDMDTKLVADGSIGVINSQNITAGGGPSVFDVNADASTTPGHIDLIDVADNVGTVTNGGPHIMTGPEGNVGYFTAGGTVYRDNTFGNSQPEETIYQPGQSATLTDDSGATVVLTPTGTPSVPPTVGTTNPTPGTTVAAGMAGGGTTTTVILQTTPTISYVGDTITLSSGMASGESAPITAQSGDTVTVTPNPAWNIPPVSGTDYTITAPVTVNPNLPQLSIEAYGIEGSGGVAIMQVVSTGGVTITSSDPIPGQTVQIGQIDALGLGQGLVRTLTLNPTGVTTPITTTSTSSSTSGSTTSGSTTGTTSGSTTAAPTTAPTYYTGADTAGPKGRTQPLPLPPMLDPNSTTPLNVIMQGTAQIGTWDVYGGFFSEIVNNTVGGEIVNTTVESVGTLSSKGTIGLAQNHTGMPLQGLSVGAQGQLTGTNTLAGNFPFNDENDGVIEETTIPSLTFTLLAATNLSGTSSNPFTPKLGMDVTAKTTTTTSTTSGATVTTTIIPVRVGPVEMGIANIIAADGIGNIDVIGTPGGAANAPTLGNIGTIRASILGPVFSDGSIYSVILGGLGIAPSGSGATSQAGLYSASQIGLVSNSAPADIRGAIMSSTGLTGVTLKHGSIINSTIGEQVLIKQGTDVSTTHDPLGNVSPITNPVLDVGNIIVTGNGGIIGTSFRGEHFGDIDVVKGFGILSSDVNNGSGSNAGDATIEQIEADGYGIRDFVDEGGSSIGKIIATGNGTNVSTQVYSADVRYSEIDSFDPYFGIAPGNLTDIDAVTGATAANPQVPGAPGMGTDTGVIDTSYFDGNRDLGTVQAYQIRAPDNVPPTEFDFADSIGTISTLSDLNGVSILTGRITTFHPGGNLINTGLTISGPIHNLNVTGNVEGTSAINAVGINGNIGTIRIGGSLQGTITATRLITNTQIAGNLTGTINAPQINTLKVIGTINGGNLEIKGNVNTLQVVGDLGVPGETLTITGSAKVIKIGGALNTNVTVSGGVGTLQVGGSIISGNTVDIGGTLKLLSVGADIQTNATVTAALIKKIKVRGVIDGVVS